MKTGWKTSEFWTMIFTFLLNLFGEQIGIEEGSIQQIAANLASVAYMISRGIAKRGQATNGASS